MSHWKRAEDSPSPQDAMEFLTAFYNTWITGDGEAFVSDLYEANAYDEEQIRQVNRDWDIFSRRESVKHIKSNPEPNRLIFKFGQNDNFDEELAQRIVDECAEVHILTADVNTGVPEDGVVVDEYTEAVEEIEAIKRHVVVKTREDEWRVVI